MSLYEVEVEVDVEVVMTCLSTEPSRKNDGNTAQH